MKKFGFTLAEILISLAIIGIVAAICIPTLGTSARKKANITTLKVTTADIETAMGAMMVASGTEEVDPAWISDGKYKKYLKMDGNKTKNGSELIGFNEYGTEFTIDVNGDGTKPDKEGYDQFKCTMDEYGLITINTEIGENEE